jgi:hypothetical protein
VSTSGKPLDAFGQRRCATGGRDQFGHLGQATGASERAVDREAQIFDCVIGGFEHVAMPPAQAGPTSASSLTNRRC